MHVSCVSVQVSEPHLSLADKPSYAYQMVRTDSKEQKLEAFVVPRSLQVSAAQSTLELSGDKEGEGAAEVGFDRIGPCYFI